MSAQDFWIEGCKITRHGLGSSESVGLRRFREHFGTSPLICEIVWSILRDQDLHPPGARPIHMLSSLLFLKLYATEHVNRALTGFDEKTQRKWQWIYVKLIACDLHVVRN